MFTVRNKVGNVYRTVATERERDRLIEEGYVEVKPKQAKEPKQAKANKAGDAE